MLFGKYWWLIPVAIVTILALAMVVQHTKDTSDIAKWVFVFLDEWSMVLSASATLLLAFTAFWAIMDNRRVRTADRREKLLNDIQNWAESGIVAIAPASLQIETNKILNELDLNLRPVAAKTLSVLIDTEKIGGDLQTKVLIVSKRLNAIGRAIQDPNKHINIVNARKILIVAFGDVIKVISDLKSQEMKS